MDDMGQMEEKPESLRIKKLKELIEEMNMLFEEPEAEAVEIEAAPETPMPEEEPIY